jgi:hypothetical protein
LLRQIPEATLHVVNERPLEAALRACYRIGLDSGATWMVTLDADVLLRDGAVGELLEIARRLPDRYVKLQGLIHDKLRGRNRQGNPYVYRTKHLQRALSCLPRDGEEIRPESSTLERLSRAGYPSYTCKTLTGFHDFEQFYRDLYRKAFVHGQKHPQWVKDTLPHWRDAAERDRDFQVTMRGFLDGFQAKESARVDVRQYAEQAERALRELGLEEKTPLDPLPNPFPGISLGEERAPARPEQTLGSLSPGARARLGLHLLGSFANRVGDTVLRWALH